MNANFYGDNNYSPHSYKEAESQFCSAKDVASYYDDIRRQKARADSREIPTIVKEEINSLRIQEISRIDKSRHIEMKNLSVAAFWTSTVLGILGLAAQIFGR